MILVDHLIYAVPDLEVAVEEIHKKLGVHPVYGGKHETLGTHNALISLGDHSYFEILAPDPEAELTADDDLRERFDHPNLLSWAVQVEHIEKKVGQFRKLGIEFGQILKNRRQLPEGGEVGWKYTTGPYMPGLEFLVPFMIEWNVGDHPSKVAPTGCSLSKIRATHPEPEKLDLVLRILGVAVEIEKGESPELKATLSTPNGEVELA